MPCEVNGCKIIHLLLNATLNVIYLYIIVILIRFFSVYV